MSDRLATKQFKAIDAFSGKVIVLGDAPTPQRTHSVFPFDATKLYDMMVSTAFEGHGIDSRDKGRKLIREGDLDRRAKLGSNLIPSISPLLTDTTPRLTKK
jgi:hypothetical protein